MRGSNCALPAAPRRSWTGSHRSWTRRRATCGCASRVKGVPRERTRLWRVAARAWAGRRRCAWKVFPMRSRHWSARWMRWASRFPSRPSDPRGSAPARAAHRALRRAHEYLKDRIDYPLLVQGTGSRSELLVRFRRLGNAVLLGAASFWEGVDVRGEALSVVLIDKLPFAPPDDPVLAARIEALRAEGGNPFMEFQLPQAVLQLKQGAGRLIRDEEDRGVLVLCDPRLYAKAYGRTLRESLPPMKQTRELADVEAFFAGI